MAWVALRHYCTEEVGFVGTGLHNQVDWCKWMEDQLWGEGE